VRVARFAVWAAPLVTMPVATDTRHSTPAFSSALAAFNVNVALDAPVFAAVAVKVVVPHPLVTGVDNELMPNEGSTNATLSFTFKGAFNTNRYETEEAAHVTGRAIVRMLVVTAGATTAVDVLMAVDAMSVVAARVTATLRVFRLAV